MEIQGFRGSMQDLERQFQLSRRLKVRIGALLALKLSISPTLLELALPGSKEEGFLLDSRLLNQVKDLTQEKVMEIWGDESCPLELIEDKEWKVLVLKEELLAKEGFETAVEEAQNRALNSLPMSLSKDSVSMLQPLFSAKDLEDLKLQALTSAEQKERIEALRKIIHLNLPLKEKGLLLLHALEEDSLEIREEVAKGFAHLGFSTEVVALIKAFSTPYSSQQVYALQRLKEYVKEAPLTEISLSFYFLRLILEKEDQPHVVKAISETLEAVILRMEDPQPLVELADQLVRILPRDKERFEPFFHKLFLVIGKKLDREKYEAFFKGHLSLTKSPYMATCLVLAMNEMDIGPPEFRVKKLVELLENIEESNPYRYRIGKNLVDLDKHSITPLIQAFPKSSPGNQAYILQLLDWCATKIKDQDRVDQIGLFFAEVLESPSPPLRKQIYESRLLKHPHLSSTSKKVLAQVLANQLEDFQGYDINLHMEEVFSNLGKEVVPLLEEIIDSTVDEEMRKDALFYIGAAGMALQETKAIEKVFQKLKDKKNLPYIDRELLIHSLAKICSSPLLPPHWAEEFAKELWEEWKNDPDEYEYWEGLGILSHSPHLKEVLQKEIVPAFLKAFHTPPPEQVEENRKEEGEIFLENEEESEYFTRFIPKVLFGLKEWACSPYLSPEICSSIIGALLEKLEKIQKWELLLGPYNEAKLVEALGEICLQDKIPSKKRAEILKKLKTHSHRMYVVRLLLLIFKKFAQEEPLGEAAAEIAYHIYKRKKALDKLSLDECKQIYQLLGSIGAVHFLGGKIMDGAKLRRMIVQTLFEGIGKKIPALDTYLEKIANLPMIEKDLAEKIQTRLKNLRALKIWEP